MLAPDYQLHWSRNVTIQLNQLTKLERSIREKRFWDRPYLRADRFQIPGAGNGRIRGRAGYLSGLWRNHQRDQKGLRLQQLAKWVPVCDLENDRQKEDLQDDCKEATGLGRDRCAGRFQSEDRQALFRQVKT